MAKPQAEHWTSAQRDARLEKLVARNRSHRSEFLYEDPEWMRDAYVTRGLSLRQVAAEADCSLRTVSRWMAVHGIERRSPLAPAVPGEITYASAHFRVRAARGKPTEHICAHCSELAHDWAYDHGDPDERANPPGVRSEGPFSLKPKHYMPLCRSCHRRFDYGRRTR